MTVLEEGFLEIFNLNHSFLVTAPVFRLKAEVP
jgi:hypothetical protein